jgi:hypothetical protein
MKARLLCILILCANTLFGQNDSSEITITSDQDWRIVSSNSENGFAYYFNPDKIWKKGSLYTCYVRLSVDSSHLAELQSKVGKKYDYSIYKLQVDCQQMNFKLVGINHHNKIGDLITLSDKNNNHFVLDKYVKESIIKNVCNATKVPWFDAKRESPF